jgi:hypothetical protein
VTLGNLVMVPFSVQSDGTPHPEGRCVGGCCVQDSQNGVIPEDGTSIIIVGAPHVQPEDGASALYCRDR